MADAAPPSDAELVGLRERIDAVDRELLGLLNRRAALAQQVGEVKRKEGSVAFRPEREAQVIDALKKQNAGPLRTESVAPIWREIMSACRALETPTRVAYLGPAGTFSELAALGYFGASIVALRCANADEVFHATSAGAADFGVVPVENSSEGVVTRSLDLFLTTPLAIVGETSLLVRHNLLARPAADPSTALARIDTVCAHAQALAQCHTWLSHHLPAADRLPTARELLRVLRPGGHLLIAEFQAPTGPFSRAVTAQLFGHAMADNDLTAILDLAHDAGAVDLTRRATRVGWLGLVHGRKPA